MVGMVANKSPQPSSAGEKQELVDISNGDSKVTASKLKKLIESQGYCCALTGWDLEPDTAHVDHVEPLARGGAHSIENLQVLHAAVNTAKGTMTNDEFIDMCCAVADNVRGR